MVTEIVLTTNAGVKLMARTVKRRHFQRILKAFDKWALVRYVHIHIPNQTKKTRNSY